MKKTPAEKLRNSEPVASGCILWKGARSDRGYGNVSVDGRTMHAHRLAWEVANGQAVPDGVMVLHSCDVRLCINPEHLHLGTAADNSREMVQRRRYRGPATLGPDDRARARQMVAAGATQREVAASFSVSQATISNIVRGKYAGDLDARWAS